MEICSTFQTDYGGCAGCLTLGSCLSKPLFFRRAGKEIFCGFLCRPHSDKATLSVTKMTTTMLHFFVHWCKVSLGMRWAWSLFKLVHTQMLKTIRGIWQQTQHSSSWKATDSRYTEFNLSFIVTERFFNLASSFFLGGGGVDPVGCSRSLQPHWSALTHVYWCFSVTFALGTAVCCC